MVDKTFKKSEWTPETAEKLAQEACLARGILPPSDFIRFSEAAVFRSGDVAVRVDQGHKGRLNGDKAKQMVEYMDSVNVSTIKAAGIETYVSDCGHNVTFYEFMAEGDDSQWETLLRGFGEQIRKIHDNASISSVRKIVPEGMETNYMRRKVVGVHKRLQQLKSAPSSHSLPTQEISLLVQRATMLKSVLLEDVDEFTQTRSDSQYIDPRYINSQYGAADSSRKQNSDQILMSGQRNLVVLHGDAHLGNATLLNDGVCVYDFEEIGFGEPFLDHLHMLLADHLFNIPSVYEHFALGYGKSFSNVKNLDAWLELMALIYITWSAGLGAVSEKHNFETSGRIRLWTDGLIDTGIASLQKNQIPFLWNAKI